MIGGRSHRASRRRGPVLAAATGVTAGGAASGQRPELPSMEGLWWVEDGRPPLEAPREERHWQLLIQPPARASLRDATREAGAEAIELDEGLSVQALHIGPYACGGAESDSASWSGWVASAPDHA